MSSEKLPRYYVTPGNGWGNIGDRECTVYGEACDHSSVITVYGHIQDGVNTGHRYATELAAILNAAAGHAPAPVAPATPDKATQRQLYKAAALQGWAAGRNVTMEDSNAPHVARSCAAYADAMLAEDEEHAKQTNEDPRPSKMLRP